MQVIAAITDAQGGPFEVGPAELDAPRDDEVLVRIRAVGVCHTDILAQAGAFQFGVPAVLGHEGAGLVEAVGAAVTGFAPGDRVAISFRSCGACPKCAAHHPAYCHTMPLLNYAGMRPDGTRALRRDGTPLASNFFGQSSFASHALTYARNLVKLPDDIPFTVAAPMGCGIQTGAGSVMNALDCPAGSTLLVTGGGAVGLSAVMAARIRGCAAILVAEPMAARREMALALGATHVFDPAGGDLAGWVRGVLPIGVDFAFDTTGRQDVLDAIMNALGPQGTLGCVGIGAPGTRLPGDLTQAMTFGHTVKAIIEGDSEPSRFLPALFEHYRRGELPVDRLVTTYPFADINAAIADQHHGHSIKVVLTFPE